MPRRPSGSTVPKPSTAFRHPCRRAWAPGRVGSAASDDVDEAVRIEVDLVEPSTGRPSKLGRPFGDLAGAQGRIAGGIALRGRLRGRAMGGKRRRGDCDGRLGLGAGDWRARGRCRRRLEALTGRGNGCRGSAAQKHGGEGREPSVARCTWARASLFPREPVIPRRLLRPLGLLRPLALRSLGKKRALLLNLTFWSNGAAHVRSTVRGADLHPHRAAAFGGAKVAVAQVLHLEAAGPREQAAEHGARQVVTAAAARMISARQHE